METVFLILARTVAVAIELAMLAMMIRMIMPLFFNVDSSIIYALCCCVSEPFIVPVRFVMSKLDIGQSTPFDWPFFITYFLLFILQLLLPTI